MTAKNLNHILMAILLLVGSKTSHADVHHDLGHLSGDQILKNPIIHLLDGVPFAFDGDTIYDMIIVNAKIFKLQYGTKNKETGQFEGMYTFNGEKHSLHSLAELELSYDHDLAQKIEQLEKKYVNFSSFEQEWKTKEKEVIKEYDDELEKEIHPKDRNVSHETARKLERINRRELDEELNKEKGLLKKKHMSDVKAYEQEYAVAKKEYDQRQAALQPIFLTIREDFGNLMKPFMSLAKGSKHFMLELIYEWSTLKQGRKDSPLLRWDETDEGAEESSFYRDMVRVHYLDAFCTDQRSMIKTIVHSCPKGYKQFQELRAKQQKQNQ